MNSYDGVIERHVPTNTSAETVGVVFDLLSDGPDEQAIMVQIAAAGMKIRRNILRPGWPVS